MFNTIVGIIFPATPTAISILASFGLLFGVLLAVVGFIYRLVSR